MYTCVPTLRVTEGAVERKSAYEGFRLWTLVFTRFILQGHITTEMNSQRKQTMTSDVLIGTAQECKGICVVELQVVAQVIARIIP